MNLEEYNRLKNREFKEGDYIRDVDLASVSGKIVGEGVVGKKYPAWKVVQPGTDREFIITKESAIPLGVV